MVDLDLVSLYDIKQEVSPVLDVMIEEEGERGGWDIR